MTDSNGPASLRHMAYIKEEEMDINIIISSHNFVKFFQEKIE